MYAATWQVDEWDATRLGSGPTSQCTSRALCVYFIPFSSRTCTTTISPGRSEGRNKPRRRSCLAIQTTAMENDLQTASTYVNNLLLARGLLKNGKPIHFATPENESGGAAATMIRIVNLVNDLVLRRDVSTLPYLFLHSILTWTPARSRAPRKSCSLNSNVEGG
jgi:hypothetical protein